MDQRNDDRSLDNLCIEKEKELVMKLARARLEKRRHLFFVHENAN